MAATETLQELLVRIRTVGEKEAKEALTRTLAQAQKDQARLIDQQTKAEKKAREDRHKALAAAATDELQTEKQRSAAIKAFDRQRLADQKEHDRKRVAQERATQRELAQAIKAGQRELKRIDDKREADRERALEGGRNAFSSMGSRLGDRIVGGAVSIGKAAAVTGAGLATGGFLAFDRFLKNTDELKTFAAFTSMTTERLQQLNFAVEQNGMSSEKFADGIRQFNAGVRESAKAGGETGAVAEAVKDLGISFKELLEMSPEDQLFAILQRGKELGPSFARAGAFAKAFGEIAGAQFARIADQGVDAIKAAAQSAKDLGFVLETATVDQAVRVNQQLEATFSIIDGVKNSIFAALLPSAEAYISKIREWILTNRELIKTGVLKWLGKLEDAAKAAWPDIQKLVKVLAEALPWLVKLGPALLQVGVGLKTVDAAKGVATTITSIGNAFKAAQGSALAFAGAGGIGAILQALAMGIPLALEFGNYLGDIGKQDTGPRKSITDKILAAQIDAFGVAGGDSYADQLSKMSDDQLASIEKEVLASERAKDIRARGKLETLFFKARQRKDELAMSNTDALREGIMEDLRHRNTAKKYSLSDLQSLVDQGVITQEAFELERGARQTGRLTGARKSEKDDKLSDAELMKLIDKAVQSGANLQDLIGQRKLAGTVPPVITVQQWITNVTATATMTVKGVEGQSPQQLAQATVEHFNMFLSDEVRKALPKGRVAR